MISEFADMRFTPVFWRNAKAWKDDSIRYVVNQGGTSSSKTISVLQLLLWIAKNNAGITISVVSETFPHLKKGAIRDFEKMLKQSGFYSEFSHNKTDQIFRINDSMIEFFSADNNDKVRGPRRDVLYINECNNISFDTYDQLEIRTKSKIFLDFNPVRQFWAHDDVIPLDNSFFIKSTYVDNPYLSEEIKKSIESKRHKSNWWRVYGMGDVGFLEGLIFPDVTLVDKMPDEYKLKAYGQDFGFTNDPSALIDVRIAHGELYFDELIYDKGLTNQDIADRYKKLKIDPLDEIIADSAEPKSIEELRRYGYKVTGARKGKDSINSGINIMQQYKINVTKRSVNLLNEFRNYQWETDRDGKFINKPIDDFNHGMDAVRYVALNKIGITKPKGLVRRN